MRMKGAPYHKNPDIAVDDASQLPGRERPPTHAHLAIVPAKSKQYTMIQGLPCPIAHGLSIPEQIDPTTSILESRLSLARIKAPATRPHVLPAHGPNEVVLSMRRPASSRFTLLQLSLQVE